MLYEVITTLMIPGETLVVQKMTYDTVKKEIVSIEQDRPAKSLTSAEEVKAAGYMVIHGDFSDLNTTIIHWKNMQYEFHVITSYSIHYTKLYEEEDHD